MLVINSSLYYDARSENHQIRSWKYVSKSSVPHLPIFMNMSHHYPNHKIKKKTIRHPKQPGLGSALRPIFQYTF
jgi:hypothetical protein